MRVGIVPTLSGANGGIYQYSVTMHRILHEWKDNGCEHHFVVFTPEITDPAVVSVINGDACTIKPLQRPSLPLQALNGLRRIIGDGPHRELWRSLRSTLS